MNCLRWHPCDEHILVSSSHDPAMLVHDIRNLSRPLHALLGHATKAR
jgi:hypothetical protein